ncbi:MAG: c-type cytochrome [Chitinophagaceae bacterium]
MYKKLLLLAVCFSLLAVLYSCQYKKEAIAYPAPATCDTAVVRYSVEIKNIIAANCNSCHAANVGNSQGGGYILDSYNALRPYAQSKLVLNVIQRNSGFSPMPKNAAKLSDCDIAKVRIWIQNGFPNN